jgi:hypothetical protein
MTPTLAQLAHEAGITVTAESEKFAELIVRECAEICLEANDHKNILRHFGVEL